MSETDTTQPKVMRGRKAVDPTGASERATEAQRARAGTGIPAGTLLRAYAAYRRAELYKPRIGGQIGGSHGVMSQSVEIILRELESLADWMDGGMPQAAATLSQADLDFWMEARRRGQEIPDDVARALPPLG